MEGTAWGLTGPEYIRLHLVVAGTLVALALVLRAVMAWAGRGKGDTAGLGLYDAAFLAGGTTRVGDTALISLIADGYAHMSRDGRVRAATGTSPADPIAAAVLDSIRTTNGSRMRLIREWRRNDVLAGVEGALVERAMVHDRLARSIGKTPIRLLLVLPLVGIVRLVNGIVRDRPVGFLIVLILGTFLVAGLVNSPFRITRAGRRAVRELTAHVRERAALDAAIPSGAATAVGVGALAALFAVACLGFAGHPDDDARAALVSFGGGVGTGTGDGGSGGGGGDGGGGCGGGGGGCGGGCGG